MAPSPPSACSSSFHDSTEPIALSCIVGGVLAAIVTAGVITFSDDRPKPESPGPPPPAVVLARSRGSAARSLMAQSGPDPRGASARLAALRADWLRMLAHSPPATGQAMARRYITAPSAWGWFAVARLVLYIAIGLLLVLTRSGFALPFVIMFSTLVSVDLWSMAPARAFRKRCLRALRDGVCPVCGYDLRGLEPVCAALPDLGPKRCPECATRWPIAPPVIADRSQSPT